MCSKMITEKIWRAPFTKKKSKNWDIRRCIALKQCSNIVGEWADKPLLFPSGEKLTPVSKRGEVQRKKIGRHYAVPTRPKGGKVRPTQKGVDNSIQKL